MRLKRDRLTWLVYSQLGAYGFFLFAFGAGQPLLKAEQGTSGLVAGLHGTALAFGAILAGIATPRAAHRFGAMRGARLSLFVFAAGVIAIVFAPPVWVTLPGALIAGFGGSLSINLQTPLLLNHHPGTAGEQAFSEGNGGGAVLGAISVLIVGLLATQGLSWRWGMLISILIVLFARLYLARGIADEHIPDEGGHQRGKLPRAYWIGWLGLVAMIGSEFSVSFWAAALIQQRTDIQLGSSTSIVMVFSGGIGLGRIFGARLTRRFFSDHVLLSVIGLTATGFAIFWTSRIPALSLVGLFLVGLGVALQYPLGVVRLMAKSQGLEELAVGKIGLGAGVAIASAPLLLGALADRFGVVGAYLLVPILLSVAVLSVLLSPTPRTARPSKKIELG